MHKPWIQRFPIEACDVRLARAVFLLLLALFTAVFNGLPGDVDGEVSFQTTSALARTGSFNLGGTPEAEALIAQSEIGPPGAFSVRSVERDGEVRHYGWFGVGHALTGLPFYALGSVMSWMSTGTQAAHRASERYGSLRSEYYQHLFVGWRNPLLSALTACLLVLMARRLGVSRSAAFLGGMGYGLCTFALPQARGWFSDVQGAFCMCAAVYCFLLLRDAWTTRRCVFLGLALALAFLTRSSLFPAVLVLNLAFVSVVLPTVGTTRVMSRKRALLACAAPQLLALVLWLVTNQLRFGNAFDSGYGPALDGGLFGGDPRVAFFGLFLSPSKGLVWMAPALLLIGYGIRRCTIGSESHLMWTLLATSLAIVLPILALVGWHGAWSFGPRYLLPALPLLWLLAILGFQRSAVDAEVRPLAWALLAAGLLTQAPAALVDTMTYHDLAVRAAEEHFAQQPSDPEATPADLAEARFRALQFDWGFAAPWVHWRILRHRVALSSEDFPSGEIFRFPSEQVLQPSQPRETGFGHLAWVDLRQRLGGNIWLAVALISLLVLFGIVDTVRGLDP